jgi:hypothetical protein
VGGAGGGGEAGSAARRGGGGRLLWGALVVGRLGVGPGRAEGAELRKDARGRQIHRRGEKVGTSFCLHFVLFSSRDSSVFFILF